MELALSGLHPCRSSPIRPALPFILGLGRFHRLPGQIIYAVPAANAQGAFVVNHPAAARPSNAPGPRARIHPPKLRNDGTRPRNASACVTDGIAFDRRRYGCAAGQQEDAEEGGAQNWLIHAWAVLSHRNSYRAAIRVFANQSIWANVISHKSASKCRYRYDGQSCDDDFFHCFPLVRQDGVPLRPDKSRIIFFFENQ